MVLNNYLKEPINCIAIDNRKATFDVINHLVKLGHNRIATITGDLETQAGQLRLDGFCDALAENHIRVPKYYITNGVFLRTPARLAAQKLLKLKNRPTAIFAASDVMALEVIDIAKANKIKIPEELSVVGFDDNPLNINSSVRLSTVFQPLVEMGRLGTERLRDVSMGQAQLPVKMVLSAKLIERKSTGVCQERLSQDNEEPEHELMETEENESN